MIDIEYVCIYCAVNNPELPLDPNLQTSNLLITFLKYASIVMQDTKGKQKPLCSLPLCFCYSTSYDSLFFHLFFSISVLKCPHVVVFDISDKFSLLVFQLL